jgi:hypothetical protein
MRRSDIALARGTPVLGRLIADRDRPLAGKVSGRRAGRPPRHLAAGGDPPGRSGPGRAVRGSSGSPRLARVAVHSPRVRQAPHRRRSRCPRGLRGSGRDCAGARARHRRPRPEPLRRPESPMLSVTAYQRTDALVATDSNEPVRTEADGAFVIGWPRCRQLHRSRRPPRVTAALARSPKPGARTFASELAREARSRAGGTDGRGPAGGEHSGSTPERLGAGSSRRRAARSRMRPRADGRFSLEDLAEGTYVVRVNAPDMAPGIASRSGREGGADERRRRDPPVSWRYGSHGTVLDTAGAAVARRNRCRGAAGAGCRGWIAWKCSSDGAGAFELLGVRPGRVTVSASHPAYARSARSAGIDVDPAKGPAEAPSGLVDRGTRSRLGPQAGRAAILSSRVEVVPRRARRRRRLFQPHRERAAGRHVSSSTRCLRVPRPWVSRCRRGPYMRVDRGKSVNVA